MQGQSKPANERPGNRWRILGWSSAALLLLVPFVAMQFTGQVDWSAADFLVFGAMLAITGLALESAVRMTPSGLARAGFAIALLTAFFVVWANLAVGIIGAEENPANSMYYGVLVIGILGTAIARGQAPGMARTMVVMVLAMALVPMAALAAGWTGTTGLALTYLFTAMVCAAWLASAWLFKRAS
jgi:hypothetical protein